MAKRSNGRHGVSGHNSGSIWLTRVYNAVDRDPEIARFQKLYANDHLKDTELAVLAGISSSTVAKMFGGVTRRPQHATFAKMAGAMGYKYDLVRKDEPNYIDAIPRARAEHKAYKDTLAKKKVRKR